MNLFEISGIAVQRDDTIQSNVISVRPATFELAITGDVLNYRVLGFEEPDDALPLITLNNDSDLTVARLDGVDITGPDSEFTETFLGFVDTPEGRHVILDLYDEATDTDFIFQIGGDALTLPDSVAGWNALEASVTGGGAIASGPFAPDQNIALDTFQNTTTSALPDGEFLTGTDGPDLLEGGTGDDTLDGQSGDDTLVGNGGNDTLEGRDGNDVLDGGLGNDLINPGENDPFFGDFIRGSTGNDTIAFSDLVEGWAPISYSNLTGPITVTVDGAANTGSVDKGPDGTDTLVDIVNVLDAGTREGGTRVTGTQVDDAFNFDLIGDQWISVGNTGGNDVINMTGGGFLQVTVQGDVGITANYATGLVQQGDSSITINGPLWEVRGSFEADQYTGSEADESFRPQGGNDVIAGSGGFDRLRYDFAGIDGIEINMVTGEARASSGDVTFTDSFSGIEWVRGSEGDDTITGDAGDNRLQGRDGNDTLDGGNGDDTIEGEGGGDTAVLGVARAEAQVSQSDGGILIASNEGNDLYLEVESFAFTDGTLSAADLLADDSPDGDTVLGTDGNDTLEGGDTDDVIASGDGDDSIDGGGGDDNIAASDGNDEVDGGDGNDSIGGGTGDDSVDGGTGNDIIGGGQGDDNAIGNIGNDIVNGGPGNDVLFGSDGNDTMGASFGDDTVFGEASDDSLGGGAGRDVIDGAEGDDSVGGGEGDDVIDGGAGSDFLAGGGRNDEIAGGAGDDSINGGDGDDSMAGGDGADMFVFNFFKDVDADIIADYEDGVDSFLIRTVNPDTGETNIENGGQGLQGFVNALNITDTLGGAEMNIGGHLVLVEGVAAADLTLDDFQFI